MKIFERRKERKQFEQAYRTANNDERKEMVQQYIINYEEDKFIIRMERKYRGWLSW